METKAYNSDMEDIEKAIKNLKRQIQKIEARKKRIKALRFKKRS